MLGLGGNKSELQKFKAAVANLSATELSYARLEIARLALSNQNLSKAIYDPGSISPNLAIELLSELNELSERGRVFLKKFPKDSINRGLIEGFQLGRAWILLRISAQNGGTLRLTSRKAWEEIRGFNEHHLKTAIRFVETKESLKSHHAIPCEFAQELTLVEYEEDIK